MNERHLRYITTIAGEGSIQKAAVILEKNPSTLTRVLRGIEQDLGSDLFTRTRKGLVLTPEGEAVMGLVRAILTCFDWLEEWICEWMDRQADSQSAQIRQKHYWTKHEIHYLLTIQDSGSITKAAEELYVAQPSLSQMLQELEQNIGMQIFARSREGIEATSFGRELLLRLETVRNLYRQIRIELEEFQDLKKGVITLGIPMNLGTYLLPLVVPAFREKYPGMEIRIRENNSQDLEKQLLARKVDFCILHFREEMEQVSYEHFFDDPFCLVIPTGMKKELRLPEDRDLTAEDLKILKRTPFVMVAARQKLRVVADQILIAAGIRPNICCTTKSMETAKRLVAAGMGVTFLPKSYLTLYSGVEGLESYPVDQGLNATWKLVAAYRKHEKLSRGCLEFLRILQMCLDGE